jgi:hypothetical protein
MHAGGDKERAEFGGGFCSSQKSEARAPVLIYLGRKETLHAQRRMMPSPFPAT